MTALNIRERNRMCQVEKPPEKVGCEELESQEPNHAAKL